VSGSGGNYAQVQANQSATEIGDYGYQFYAAEGEQSHEFGNIEYKSPWGLLSAGADRIQGHTDFRIEDEGAISVIDGGVFPSPPVQNAFAVVDTGGIRDIHVMRENRNVGQTDSDGRFLVPDLRAFDVNHIAIDPNDVPADTILTSVNRDIRPRDRVGVVVSFALRPSHSALLRLVDERGSIIPVGSRASLSGSDRMVPVGYDGDAYVDGLDEQNALAVEKPDGSRCTATFEYHPVSGDIPSIGPLTCRDKR